MENQKSCCCAGESAEMKAAEAGCCCAGEGTGSGNSRKMTMRTDEQKKKLLNRLKRIEGQVCGHSENDRRRRLLQRYSDTVGGRQRGDERI